MSIGSRKQSYWVHTSISLMLMLGFGFIPPILGFTQMGMALLGVLVGAVYGWITLEIAWPSLAGLLALAIWGYDSMNNILKNSFGNSTVVMMLFILVFTMYMSRCGCMDAITKWFISRKIIVGRPYVVLFVFYALGVILSFATSNIAAMLFLISVAIPFCENLGYKRKDKYPIALIFAIYLGTQCGLTVIPIKPPMLMMISLIEAASGIMVDTATWILFFGALHIVALLVWIAVVRFLIRPEVDTFKNMTENDFAEYRNIKIPTEAKIGFAAITIMMLFMLIPTFLPKAWAITAFCSKIDIAGAILLVFVLIAIMPKEGSAKFNFQIVANSEKMNWNVILMTAFALTIASALSSDSTGFNETINTYLVPLMSAFNPAVMIFVFSTILHFMTNILNNSAMSAIFINPMVAVASALGMNLFFTPATAMVGMFDGLLSPAGTASAPLLMGHEWMDMKEYYKNSFGIFAGFELFLLIAAVVLF